MEREEKVIRKISNVAAKGIQDIEKLQGSKEIDKSELVRDLSLSLISRIQKLWNDSNFDELKLYGELVVDKITKIVDVARKTNRDIFEMKFGKKVTIEKKGALADEIDRLMAIDVTPEPLKEIGNGNETRDKGKTN